MDSYSPPLGAGAFKLDVTNPPTPPHTEVLWYESITFAEQPTRLELNKNSVEINESCTATVALYNDGSATWSPLPGATVYAGTEFMTGAGGTVSFSFDNSGLVGIYAEKDGCIRSNTELLNVEWTVMSYDDDDNETIDYGEMVDALRDYLAGQITYAQMVKVLTEYLIT